MCVCNVAEMVQFCWEEVPLAATEGAGGGGGGLEGSFVGVHCASERNL